MSTKTAEQVAESLGVTKPFSITNIRCMLIGLAAVVNRDPSHFITPPDDPGYWTEQRMADSVPSSALWAATELRRMDKKIKLSAEELAEVLLDAVRQ